MNLSKKQIRALIVVVAAIIVLVGIRQVIVARNSDVTNKRNQQVLDFCLDGWQVKEFARLDANKDKIRDLKRLLMNYYDAKSGELAVQQRLVDTLIAADKAKDNQADASTNTPLKVLSFRITDVKVKSMYVGGTSADITADIQYFIKYDTQHENYSDLAKNTYRWQLKKDNGGWKITKEDLIVGDAK